jgi:4-amino-4-deoxy-L-arabinose transferase-like glycosyltransferase
VKGGLSESAAGRAPFLTFPRNQAGEGTERTFARTSQTAVARWQRAVRVEGPLKKAGESEEGGPEVRLRGALLAGGVGFALALVLLAQGITKPFIKDDEPQSAQWIESVASGRHWLIPRDYYGMMDRKPPLFYWLAGAVTAASGGPVDETTARAVSLVAAAAIAVEVLLWCESAIGAATGWLAFFFLIGSYAFASRATLALTDMTLCFFVFSAWCILFPALEGEPSRRRAAAAGAILGLGILTKGPVAIVICALAAVFYLLLAGRPVLKVLSRPWPWVVLAVAAAIAAPWYAAASIRGGREFARIFFQENTGHFLPAVLGGTGEAARPVYYIALKVLSGAMPLTFLVPALTVALWPRGIEAARRKPVLFQLSLTLAVVALFSVASAKRDDYVLPAMPGLAIGLAALFTALEREDGRAARWAAKLRDATAALVAAGTLALLAGAALWLRAGASTAWEIGRLGPADRGTAQLFFGFAHGLAAPFVAMMCAAAVAAAGIAIGLGRRKSGVAGALLALLSLAGVLLFTAVIRPRLDRERTLKYAAHGVERIADAAPLYIVRGQDYGLSFYRGRKVAPLLMRHNIVRAVSGRCYLFAYGREMASVAGALRGRLRMVARWPLEGSTGPAELYLIGPRAKDLNGGARALRARAFQ